MLNWDKEDRKGRNEGLGITYQRFGTKHEQKEIHAASTAALVVASGFARRASVTESKNMVLLQHPHQSSILRPPHSQPRRSETHMQHQKSKDEKMGFLN
jgi:hypothetical protein